MRKSTTFLCALLDEIQFVIMIPYNMIHPFISSRFNDQKQLGIIQLLYFDHYFYTWEVDQFILIKLNSDKITTIKKKKPRQITSIIT